jgi:predicted neuraminidase
VRAKPITLADGSLLAPTSVESYQAWTAYVDRSTDGGKTWRRSTPIAVPGKPFGLIQPTLIETAPGHVMALCRSRGIGFICRADSTDGGVTWSPAQPTTLANPNSGIDAVRTTTGDIYLIYNPTKLRRTPLNLDRSRDGGQTWETVQVLEEDAGEFSYPAIILTSDGSLQMVYTWNRQKIRHVVVRLK